MSLNERDLLRNLKCLEGPFTPFDVFATASDPQEQFRTWLDDAINAGVQEPHAMTLSTVDQDGNPDARVLILKNLDDQGWHFAISGRSPKGRQLDRRPQAALTFYWALLGRQVRIRGAAISMGAATSAADFLSRSTGSRAGALMEKQSDVLVNSADLDAALAKQHERISHQPKLVATSWMVYAVRPDVVEFWQGHQQRRHTRLRYRRGTSGWDKELLWP